MQQLRVMGKEIVAGRFIKLSLEVVKFPSEVRPADHLAIYPYSRPDDVQNIINKLWDVPEAEKLIAVSGSVTSIYARHGKQHNCAF